VTVTLLVLVWLASQSWIVRTTQGTYEDTIHLANAQGTRTAPAFSVTSRRWLTNWTLWHQFRIAPAPWRMRAVNLLLSGIVAVLVGWLATSLNVSGLMASAVMLVHPLTVESLATISGRAELFAALGVVGACLALLRLPRISGAIVALGCLMLGVLGKESAGLAIVLAPLCLLAARPTKAVWGMLLIASLIAAVMIGVIRTDLVTADTSIHAGAWALSQMTATFRLVCLAVLPLGQTVDYDYDHAARAMQIASVFGVLSLALLVPLLWQRYRIEALGIAWVLIVCAPRWIVQSPRNYLNEHGFYLALVGVSLVIAALAQRQFAHDVS
jgi:hypothetical protein